MAFKKINAVIGLICAVLLFDHSLSCSILMLTKDLSKATPVPAFILMGLTLLHVAVSIFFVMSHHDGSSTKYGALYVRMILQRLSAILMIAVLPLHVYSAIGMRNGLSTETLFVVSNIFFTVFSMIHTAFSVPNALITLGVATSEKRFKVISAVSGAVFGILAVLGVVSGVMFLWK